MSSIYAAAYLCRADKLYYRDRSRADVRAAPALNAGHNAEFFAHFEIVSPRKRGEIRGHQVHRTYSDASAAADARAVMLVFRSFRGGAQAVMSGMSSAEVA